MKHLLLIGITLFLSATLFSSCKKAYKCDCGGQVVNAYSQKFSKKEAKLEKAKCEATPNCLFLRDK